ncbi:MAG TPA: Na/Pi cotransporter family protein [Soehngenia sp.]|nr:Na/Pi cotransporter family protein [Soehngenia sp.]
MSLIIPVLGGLGMFLYGMTMMGSGLEKAAGNRLKSIIEALTTNRLMGVLVGTAVTMIIQSSSATTVMVIGFVNAGLMTLPQAAGVIMGANIGTTITAQLIAFDLEFIAPIAVAIGVAIWMIAKNKNAKSYAEILIGFGILFIGMGMMSDGLKPFAELPAFTRIITSLNNPILGMLVGLGITTLVQSSSASIGLLEALAKEGLVTIGISLPILFGSNIGTTTTALISSVGANKTAKRAAVIHFLFNVVGTLLFMTFLSYPIRKLVVYISPNDVTRQIANAHTLFNVINVIVLFPFANLLVKAAEKLIPGEDEVEVAAAIYLDKRIIQTPSIALAQAKKETLRMGELVHDNLLACQRVIIEDKIDEVDSILEKEQIVNKIQREITEYLVALSNAPLSDEQHADINAMLYVIGDIERVGDHVENITEQAQFKYENNIYFTPDAIRELTEMFDLCKKVFETAMVSYRDIDENLARQVLALEDEVDRLEKQNRANHIERLNQMLCSTGAGVVFLDVISNLERVSDHSRNIAMYVLDKFKE